MRGVCVHFGDGVYFMLCARVLSFVCARSSQLRRSSVHKSAMCDVEFFAQYAKGAEDVFAHNTHRNKMVTLVRVWIFHNMSAGFFLTCEKKMRCF